MAKSKSFENLFVYQLSEKLANEIWRIVRKWDFFAQDTVGKQLVRAADSIGANIAEGTGRGTYRDNKRFVRTARGSLYETRHWLRRAYRRELLNKTSVNLMTPIVKDLAPKLNADLRSIGKTNGKPMTND
jgi:four helix bundle protein